MSWTKIACPKDIAPGECKPYEAGGEAIAIFNVDGKFHATSNVCTHAFAYLTEGYFEGELIECPLHQGRFNVVTGQPEDGPVDTPIKVFPIRVEADEIQVDL